MLSGPVTPPPRNAATSLSFTPFVLKTTSVPTSLKLYKAAPLNEDLYNELLGATIEEPSRTRGRDPSHYVLELYQQYQQSQDSGVRDPTLSDLNGDPTPLYDVKRKSWQPLLLPNILRHSPLTAHGQTAPAPIEDDSLSSGRRKKRKRRSLTITRTVPSLDSKGTVVETEEGTYIPRAGTEETKTASWLNHITAAMCHVAPSSGSLQTRSKRRTVIDTRRLWSAEFATKPAPTDFDMKMKPDVALLQKDPFDPSGPNSWRDVVSFLEISSTRDWSRMSKQVSRKAYAIFVAQPGRRFVIALSISQLLFRLHLFDRSGAVHSRGYSIHRSADLLIRVLYLLVFAPKDFVGYDPTLFFSPVITRSNQLRTPATIQVGDETFIIVNLIFSSDMIRGRATLCFSVRRPSEAKLYVVKISWARMGRVNNEEQILTRIKERGLTYGVPILVIAWTVQIRGVDDSTSLRRPDYLLRNLTPDELPEVRIHRRLLLEHVGKPIEQFSCIHELISVLIDIIDVHELLVVRCDVLHRDVSIKNALMYDFPYESQQWQSGSNDPKILARLSAREEILRQHKYHRGLLIDFDYAKFLDEEQSVSEGERTGTVPFMALDILRAFGSETAVNVTHQPKHDLESIVYVLIWMCILYSSPGVEPLPVQSTYLRAWASCKTLAEVVVLWSTKTGELTTRAPLEYFTPYFKSLVPYVKRLYNAIRDDHQNPVATPLTHDVLRNILLDAFFEVEEPKRVSPQAATARRQLGIDIPAKRKPIGQVHPETSKRSRR